MSTEKQTIEQIDAKVSELAIQEGCDVKPFILTAPDGEQIVGYLRSPSPDIVLYVGDSFMQGNYSAGKEAALKDMLIVKESNPRILSKERKDARIYAAACREAANFTSPLVDEYKKNSSPI